MPGRTDTSERRTLGDAEQATKECAELEVEIPELRAAYEQYFLGLDRLPPSKKHERIKKRVQSLKGQFIRQTALKFRIQSLAQKLVTYERLWDRTIKEIEAGTYSRDLFKAKLHQKKRKDHSKEGNGADADHQFDVDEDLDLSDLDGDLDSALAEASSTVSQPAPVAPAPVTPVAPPLAARPPTGSIPAVKPVTGSLPTIAPVAPLPVKPVTGGRPVITAPMTGSQPALKPAVTGSQPALKPAVTGSQPAFKPGGAPAARPASQPPAASAGAGAPGGLTDQKIKAIYDAYVMAKKRCGEDTRSLTLDSVASTLKKQVPELMKQHKAKAVDFKVVIKDGKAVLRALPKEGQ